MNKSVPYRKQLILLFQPFVKYPINSFIGNSPLQLNLCHTEDDFRYCVVVWVCCLLAKSMFSG